MINAVPILFPEEEKEDQTRLDQMNIDGTVDDSNISNDNSLLSDCKEDGKNTENEEHK